MRTKKTLTELFTEAEKMLVEQGYVTPKNGDIRKYSFELYLTYPQVRNQTHVISLYGTRRSGKTTWEFVRYIDTDGIRTESNIVRAFDTDFDTEKIGGFRLIPHGSNKPFRGAFLAALLPKDKRRELILQELGV